MVEGDVVMTKAGRLIGFIALMSSPDVLVYEYSRDRVRWIYCEHLITA